MNNNNIHHREHRGHRELLLTICSLCVLCVLCGEIRAATEVLSGRNGITITADAGATPPKIWVEISTPLPSAQGGTANGYTKFTGPTTAEKTFTLPDSSCTLLYSGGALGTPSGGTLTNCTFPTLNQNTSGTAAKATILETTRGIYGNNFDGSAALSGIIASTYGGTGNGFTKFTGPATAERTFTLPNSDATLLYSGGALGTPSGGTLTNCTFPTLNQDTTGTAAKATNLKGGNNTTLLGSIGYQSDVDTTTLLSPNTTTTKKFLRQTGPGGGNGAVPAWDTVTSTDVGLGSVENTALSTWAGTANVTTLGTVTTGTWNATAIATSKGGTGNAYTKFTGPTTSEKTFTLPDANATLLKTGANAASYVSTTVADSANGATVNIDLSAGNVHLITISASTTLTFTAPASGYRGALVLLQSGAGSFTITWPAIKWPAATAPTLTTTSGKKDVVWIIYDGTDYLGGSAANF